MTEPNAENQIKEIIRQSPISENTTQKEDHLRLPHLLGEGYIRMQKSVRDENTVEKTEKVVLQGTQEETILPEEKPFILRSGARSGCDASLLLEVRDYGLAQAALSHWGPMDMERNAHATNISRLIGQTIKGKRFAILVSGTIKDLREAETTDLYQKMTEWNGGRKPDLVYIPFQAIDLLKIITKTLYQLVLSAKTKDGVPQYEVSVPGTEYIRSFTPQSLPEVTNENIAIRHEV